MKRLIYIRMIGTLLFMAGICQACVRDDVIQSAETDAATLNGADGIGEARVMVIRLVDASESGSASRADDDDDSTFENGDDAESAVCNDDVVFYFFDEDGQACLLHFDGEWGETVNYVRATSDEFTWHKVTDPNSSISSYSEGVVLLDNILSEPAYVVAVINDVQDAYTIDSLDDLREYYYNDKYACEDHGGTYFTMCNSVYVDEQGNIIDATPIDSDNMGEAGNEDKIDPLVIYVERLAAKTEVNFTNAEAVDSHVVKVTDDTHTLYAKIDNWQLFDTAPYGYLLKNISGYSASDWVWNSPEKHRSYWAIAEWNLVDDFEDFQLQNQTLTWNDISTPVGDGNFAYAFENTGEFNTKVIVAATLYEDEACTQPADICKYRAEEYTLQELKEKIAGLLASYLQVKDSSGQLVAITPDCIEFTAAETYHAAVTLKEGVTYYDANGTQLDTESLNEIKTNYVDKLAHPQIWYQGRCYYYANIIHTNGARAMVRNHWYRLSINSLTGLGTPVFDPDSPFDPTRPVDNDWELNSNITIRSWTVHTYHRLLS